MKRIVSWLLMGCILVSLSGCGKTTVDKWQEQYDLGAKYLSEGDYKEAVLAFTVAIEIDDKKQEAYVGLAEAYAAQDDWDSAAEALQRGLNTCTETEKLEEKLEDLGFVRDENGQVVKFDYAAWLDELPSMEIWEPMNCLMANTELEPLLRELLEEILWVKENYPIKNKAKLLYRLSTVYYALGEFDKAMEIRAELYEITGEEFHDPNGHAHAISGGTAFEDGFGREYARDYAVDDYVVHSETQYDESGRKIHHYGVQEFETYTITDTMDWEYEDGRLLKYTYVQSESKFNSIDTTIKEYSYEGNSVLCHTTNRLEIHDRVDVDESWEKAEIDKYGLHPKDGWAEFEP